MAQQVQTTSTASLYPHMVHQLNTNLLLFLFLILFFRALIRWRRRGQTVRHIIHLRFYSFILLAPWFSLAWICLWSRKNISVCNKAPKGKWRSVWAVHDNDIAYFTFFFTRKAYTLAKRGATGFKTFGNHCNNTNKLSGFVHFEMNAC